MCNRWDSHASIRRACMFVAILALLLLPQRSLFAQPLDQISEQRWARLREAERYQMKIAEEYYRQGKFKPALVEYEKFLSLYEKSELAGYAQLKWGLCQVQLKKLNTAIKDGFQTVIDYWPDSPDAVTAAYLIGRTYKEMGETRPAKKAYATVLQKHSKELVGLLARVDLLDIARTENDVPRRTALWREVVYDTKRDNQTRGYCENASREFAMHAFQSGDCAEAIKALASTYPSDQLPAQVVEYSRQPLQTLTAQPETKPTGEKVADQAVAWLQQQTPADVSEPKDKTLARQCYYAMAEIENSARRGDRVAEIFQQCLAKYGQDDETLGRYGNLLRVQGKHNLARELYLKFENKVNGLSLIAQSYRDEQKWEDAVKTYERCAQEDKELAHQWLSQAAWTWRLGRRCDEAVAVYQTLVTSDTERSNAWQFEIGNTYRDHGRYKEAIGVYRLCDNFPDCYWQMAGCHRALSEFGEAIGLYQQIIGGHEAWAPQSLLQIGYTLEQSGDKEKAIKTLQAVCKKHARSPYAAEAHAYLNDKFGIRITLGGDAKEE